MNWEAIVQKTQKVTAGISIILNLFLTFLIFTKSSKKLGSYKFLMYYISWFEICYSIIDALISPIILSFESIFVVVVYSKDSIFPKWLLLSLDIVYCGLFGTSMGMFSLQFIYRYFVSVGSTYLKSFNDSRIVFWMMIPVAYGVTWGALCYFFCSPTLLINEKLNQKLTTEFNWEIEDVVYVGTYFYQFQPDGSYNVDLRSVLSISTLWVILGSSITAIFYFGVKCYLRLTKSISKKMTNTSQNLKNLQAQLFYALVAQSIIPVILMHLPLSAVYLSSFLNKGIGMLSSVVVVTVALFPALDPLPTMFIVKSYRNTIFGYFKRTSKSKRGPSMKLENIATVETSRH